MTTLQTLQRDKLTLFTLVIYLRIRIHHEDEEHSLEKPYTTCNAGKLVCYEPFDPLHRKNIEEGRKEKVVYLGLSAEAPHPAQVGRGDGETEVDARPTLHPPAHHHPLLLLRHHLALPRCYLQPLQVLRGDRQDGGSRLHTL